MRQLSIRSKIILVLLLTGLTCLGTGGVIGYLSSKAALTEAVNEKLIGQRETKRLQLDRYIRDQLRLTEAVGEAPAVVTATKEMIDAFHDMRAVVQSDPAGQEADSKALEDWYSKQLLPRLDKVAGSHTPIEGLLPADPVARRLQADYIARNPHPAGKKNLLMAGSGASRYDVVHRRHHPILEKFAKTVGFYDINLMDAATGDVVYTVAKEADFGSNMFTGPLAKSGFARAARRALDPQNGGRAVIEDFTAYLPSGFEPQMFAAVPVIADGKTIGVFVSQVDIGALDNLITDNRQFDAVGQGKTGEVQLIGEDRLLRSQSRFLMEDADAFLARIKANGVPAATVDHIRALGTTILNMPDHTEAIERALRNETGVMRGRGVRNADMVIAYGPVEVAGLRWAIQAKQDESEAFATLTRLERNLLIASALAAILLTSLAMACAGLFLRPLRYVIGGMRAFTASGSLAPLAVKGNDEFGELAHSYNAMADAIAERDSKVRAAEAKVDSLLGMLYPAGLVERVRSGAQLSAETIPNVTVAVTWMDGLDALTSNRDAAEMNDILNVLLDALNTAAANHGVEPLRSLGESHIAVCGLSSPRLDHASRTLAWTQSAALAVQRLGTDWAKSITLRIGLASGEIDVLLIGHGHGAYDIWGSTLSTARRIALEAESGFVRVSESTYAMLTHIDGFEACPAITGPMFGTLKSWTRPAVPSGQPATAADSRPRAQVVG